MSFLLAIALAMVLMLFGVAIGGIMLEAFLRWSLNPSPIRLLTKGRGRNDGVGWFRFGSGRRR